MTLFRHELRRELVGPFSILLLPCICEEWRGPAPVRSVVWRDHDVNVSQRLFRLRSRGMRIAIGWHLRLIMEVI